MTFLPLPPFNIPKLEYWANIYAEAWANIYAEKYVLFPSINFYTFIYRTILFLGHRIKIFKKFLKTKFRPKCVFKNYLKMKRNTLITTVLMHLEGLDLTNFLGPLQINLYLFIYWPTGKCIINRSILFNIQL